MCNAFIRPIFRNLWGSLVKSMMEMLTSTKTCLVQQRTLEVRCAKCSSRHKSCWCAHFQNIGLCCTSIRTDPYVFTSCLRICMCIYSRWKGQRWHKPSPGRTSPGRTNPGCTTSARAPHYEPPSAPQSTGQRKLWQGKTTQSHTANTKKHLQIAHIKSKCTTYTMIFFCHKLIEYWELWLHFCDKQPSWCILQQIVILKGDALNFWLCHLHCSMYLTLI